MLWVCLAVQAPFSPHAEGQDILPHKSIVNPETAVVNWVKQYPSASENQNDRRFGEKFADFIFGKKNKAELTRPIAITGLNPQLYWTIDQENGLIFKIEKEVGEITQFRKKQFKSYPSLVGICSLPAGNLLFTDSFLNKVFISSPDKKKVRSLNDSLFFDRPTGIAFSPLSGEIWVVETNAHRITVVSEQGKYIRRIGSRGIGPGQFNFPTSLCVDYTGKFYIVDALNYRIQVMSGKGELLGMFGKNGDAAGNFARPKGIAADSYGNIYVADALLNVVQIFNPSGNFLYSFGKQGQAKGEFWMPSGIFIDEKDYIYIADSYNARIQVFHLNVNGGME